MIEDRQKKMTGYLEKAIGIIVKMGIKIVDFRTRYVKVLLPLKPNVNHIGTIYAGSLFSLADFAGGVLFFASFDHARYFPILKEVTIRYIRPATSSVTVELEFAPEQVGQILKTAEEQGKAEWIMDMELKDEAGQICCLVHGIFQMRKK